MRLGAAFRGRGYTRVAVGASLPAVRRYRRFVPAVRRYRQLVLTGRLGGGDVLVGWAVVMSSSAAAVTMRMGRLGFGGAPIGGLYRDVDATDALAALEEAWRCGVRYFDTAPHYGAGRSELLIGEFLAAKPRAEAVVSTKVGRLLLTDPGRGADDPAFPTERGVRRVFDFSADGVRRSLDASLQRLRLDSVDIVYLHDPDAHWQQAVDEALPALYPLRETGVLRAIGVGMTQTRLLERFVRETDIDVVLIAGRYSLLDRHAEAGLFPACSDADVPVVVGGVFNGGILADPENSSLYDYRPAPPEIRAKAERLRRICAEFGVPLAAAAVQFPLRHPAVRTVLVGVRNAAEMRTDAELLDMPIPDALWARLDAVGEPEAPA